VSGFEVVVLTCRCIHYVCRAIESLFFLLASPSACVCGHVPPCLVLHLLE